MATRLTSSTFGYQNFFSATLSADITSGATSIGLSAVPTSTAGILVIEPDSTTNREVILYTSKGASTVTCPSDGRGYSGSTAVSHLQGAAVIMAPVDKWFTALASGELSSDPLRTEHFSDYVASGLVWTADAAGSTKNASMTSGVLYILGKRLTLAAVTARVFTASKDTYIDVSDNGDGTGLITYNEVSNNAASPALATNNVRIGVIVTGATNIAATTSIANGNLANILPIISSRAFTEADSLGNSIYPKGPVRSHKLVNPYKFSVYRAAAWVTGTANQFNKVAFDTKIFDTGVNFDVVTNNRFVAPVAGYYQFSATVGNSANADYVQVGLYKNGVQVKLGEAKINAAGAIQSKSTVSGLVQMAANDYMEVFYFNNGTNQAGLVGAVNTFFDGFLVSGI